MSSTLKLSLPCDQLPTILCLNNIVSESLTGCRLTMSYPPFLMSWFSSNATTSCDTPGNCTALRYSRNSSPFIFPDEVFHYTQTQPHQPCWSTIWANRTVKYFRDIVRAALSSVSLPVASLLRLFKLPQISPSTVASFCGSSSVYPQYPHTLKGLPWVTMICCWLCRCCYCCLLQTLSVML